MLFSNKNCKIFEISFQAEKTRLSPALLAKMTNSGSLVKLNPNEIFQNDDTQIFLPAKFNFDLIRLKYVIKLYTPFYLQDFHNDVVYPLRRSKWKLLMVHTDWGRDPTTKVKCKVKTFRELILLDVKMKILKPVNQIGIHN